MKPRWLRPVLLALSPLLYLAAVILGVWIVIQRPLALLGWLLAGLALVPIVWVLISALWPARAERSCPACGQDTLERSDPESTQGLACRACDWRDEHASSWLLAEEEGPLEGIVLAQRGRDARPAQRPPTPLDSSGGTV